MTSQEPLRLAAWTMVPRRSKRDFQVEDWRTAIAMCMNVVSEFNSCLFASVILSLKFERRSLTAVMLVTNCLNHR